MRIVYAPHDGEKREWDWKPAAMASHESEAIEDATGWGWYEYVQRFIAGSTLARRALLWVLLRREIPRLQFDQVRFTLDEFIDEYDDEEISRGQAALESASSGDALDDAARERFRELLAQTADAGVGPGKDMGSGDESGSGT